MFRYTMFIVVAIGVASAAAAQEFREKAVERPPGTLREALRDFSDARTSFQKLIHTHHKAVPEKVRPAVMELDASMERLDLKPLEERAIDAPAEYVVSVRADVSAVQQGTKDISAAIDDEPTAREKVFERAVGSVQFAVADMGLKAAYSTANPSNPHAPIRVTVVTKQYGNVVNGLDVWYCPRGQADDKQYHRTYGKQSSPTTEGLVPGIYLMWSKKPAAPDRGEDKTVTVMDPAGVNVDLAAP